MVSALYVLHIPINNDYVISDSSNFQCLISRRFHEDHIPEDLIILNIFYKKIIKSLKEDLAPVLFIDNLSYIYIRCDNDIWILATTNKNENVMSVIMFLRNFQLILQHYLCKNKAKHHSQQSLTREVLLDNSVLISELIDECLDFGVLQITDYKLLEEYIKVEPNLPKIDQGEESESEDSNYSSEDENIKSNGKSKNKNKKDQNKKDIKSTHNQAVKTDVLEKQPNVINSSILRTYSSAINWRPKGIFYAKNEIFIDIIEDCEFIYDIQTSTIKRNEIYGTCIVKSFLSGIPICRVGFNENYMSSIGNDDEAVIEATRHDEEEELPENQIGDDNTLIDEDEMDDVASQSSSQVSLLSNKSQPRHKIPIRNIQFHQCIELSKIYRENIVTFIPPDDKFVLMTYHVEQHKNKKKLPLILIKPIFKIDKINEKLQVMCTLTTNFPRRRHCRSLLIRIPLNPFYFDVNLSDTDLKYKTENGEVSFKFDSMEIIWKIESIDGKKSVRMMCELSLLNSKYIKLQNISDFIFRKVDKENLTKINDENSDIDAMNELDDFYGVNGNDRSTSNKQMLQKIKHKFTSDDIIVTFKIPMFTYSGLKLSYLSVKEEQLEYSCFPWIRYLTKSSDKIGEINDNEVINGSNCMYRFKLGVDCFIIE
ncbi:uncharacterized protein KGF55_001788 [Candida pseudojiufengensis]|uniref:uncharacterized protein n=1 Tax=Candida pseudojiufengensis TaxID=497109 RepID=UPI0022249F02|nr:uncharacterized protein KGF55_001788 [Candida pseudojiufengensis]KAI5964719.1 hypothetical protein KGF55_001788 [Candida pseudojiufengensis]